MRASSTTTLSSWLVLGFALVALPVQAGSFWSELFDPKDGQFDVSQMLAKDLGFLPVPILITEPAIGFGGGLAAVFFHDDPEEAKRREEAFQHLSRHAAEETTLDVNSTYRGDTRPG